jgi:Secretion system C-terminal sorting domain/Endonuclease/Exonuclease/phosphatase family
MLTKATIISGIFLFITLSLFAQDTVRVMTYNLLNYGNYTTYCPQTTNDRDDKAAYLRDIIQAIQPDVFAANEVGANSFNLNHLDTSVMNYNGTNRYEIASYSNASSSDLCNAFFYDKDKFELISMPLANSYVRDINIYKLRYKNAYPDLFMHFIVVHLKAGSGTSDKADRTTMINNLMSYITTMPSNEHYYILGDFNIYTSTETAFQALINPSNTYVVFDDPINKIGSWNNNSTYKDYHTQSTHTISGCHASGGMDDRFDMILLSTDLLNQSNGVHYINGSYTTFGQDGNRFNSSVISPTNTAVSTTMANTLYQMSDHLPVYLDVKLESNMVGLEKETNNTNIQIYPNPTKGKITIQCKDMQQLEILDITGKQLYKQAFSSDIVDIDISTFSKGLYFVKVTTKDAVAVERIVLE